MSSVAVIIPAYNEEKTIRACVESLFRQTYKNLEIHIIDDDSTDSTWSILSELKEKKPEQLHIYRFGKLGPGKARNRIALQSEAKLLAFMDADCEAFADWVERLVDGFEKTNADSVGGPHLAPPTSSDFQKTVEGFFKSFSKLGAFYKKDRSLKETDHNPLCNVAYRKEVFQKLNGFREDLFPGEDYEMDKRLRKNNGKIFYNPEAVVFHHRPESLNDFRKVMFAYGRSQGKLCREKGPHRLQHILGLALFLGAPSLGIAISGLTGSLVPLLVIASLFVIVFYFRLPQSFGSLALFASGFEWFKGFLKGFVLNKSLPPGYVAKESP